MPAGWFAGQSMGGAVVFLATCKDGPLYGRVHGTVLLGPMCRISPGMQPPDWVVRSEPRGLSPTPILPHVDVSGPDCCWGVSGILLPNTSAGAGAKYGEAVLQGPQSQATVAFCFQPPNPQPGPTLAPCAERSLWRSAVAKDYEASLQDELIYHQRPRLGTAYQMREATIAVGEHAQYGARFLASSGCGFGFPLARRSKLVWRSTTAPSSSCTATQTWSPCPSPGAALPVAATPPRAQTHADMWHSQDLYNRASSTIKKLILYLGFYHALLSEPEGGREQVRLTHWHVHTHTHTRG